MAIAVKITQVERLDLEQLRVVVEFSEAGSTLTREYRLTTVDTLTQAALKARLKADRDALAALTAAQTTLSALVNQTLTL